MTPKQKQLEAIIQPLLDNISQHPLFSAICSVEILQQFAEQHVYAVYDFMCLLKALQRRIAHTYILWLPPTDYLGCHLINHLMSEEESDRLADGRYLSHFDLYLEAMQQCGADTAAITQFIGDIRQHMPLYKLLGQTYIPSAARQFMADTFTIIAKPTHEIAASFAYARELITSEMFTPILGQITQTQQTHNLSKFMTYFQRHIELDSGQHSAQAKLLVANLCGSDAEKWQKATNAAIFSLNSRLQFLDSIYAQITTPQLPMKQG